MNEYLSRKVKFLSFLSIIMVVYIHFTFCLTLDPNSSGEEVGLFNYFMESVFRNGITQFAVPLFFVISGYLFFQNMRGLKHEFISKYKSRFRTLFIPYVFWNSFWILFTLAFCFFGAKMNLLEKPLEEMQMITTLQSWKLFLLNYILPSPNIPLWYVRDLMMLVLLSPIVYFLIKKWKLVPILVCLVLFLVSYNPELKLVEGSAPFVGFLMTSLLFFFLGAYFAIHRQDLFMKRWTDKKYPILFGTIWILLILFNAVCVVTYQDENLTRAVAKVFVFFGLAFVWTVYDVLIQKLDLRFLDKLLPYTFIIYVCHLGVNNIIYHFVYHFTGISAAVQLVGYFVIPFLTICFCVLGGMVFNRFLPKFYRLVIGGR